MTCGSHHKCDSECMVPSGIETRGDDCWPNTAKQASVAVAPLSLSSCFRLCPQPACIPQHLHDLAHTCMRYKRR